MKKPETAVHTPKSLLTALDYAYSLLARRSYAEQELADTMLAKGFTDAAVARTVARLKEQGYLNDAQLAADQAERLRQRGFGMERVRAKLRQKGISPDIIERVFAFDEPGDELENARRFLASRFSPDALKQPKIVARAFRLLLNRGYSQEVAEQLLESRRDDV